MKQSSGGRPFTVKSFASDSFSPVELFNPEKSAAALAAIDEGTDTPRATIDMTRAMLMDSQSTLPLFAERYNISANPKDYVMIPIVILPSELPNRNAVGFPYAELMTANVDAGCIAFQTWKNKPTFADHVNQDFTKAKGIVFASTLRRLNDKLHKVVCLCGFDRSRDAVLANSILTGKRNSYSMGAWCRQFTCSICDTRFNKQVTACAHMNLKKPRLSLVNKGGRQEVAYLRGHDILGFEVSSVEKPAYVSATSDDLISW